MKPLFLLPGVHNPLLLSDDFNPALPRQSSVVTWELPCASRDKSHQESLALGRCRWDKGFDHGAPLGCDSPGTASFQRGMPSWHSGHSGVTGAIGGSLRFPP